MLQRSGYWLIWPNISAAVASKPPKNHTKRELTNGYRIRRGAIDHNTPLMTNVRLAKAFIEAFTALSQDDIKIKSWQEYNS